MLTITWKNLIAVAGAGLCCGVNNGNPDILSASGKRILSEHPLGGLLRKRCGGIESHLPQLYLHYTLWKNFS